MTNRPGRPRKDAVADPEFALVVYSSRDRREGRAALAGLLIATFLSMDAHPDVELLERARTALDEALRAPQNGQGRP